MNDSYVFISYAREDRHFVELLTASLREAGIRTWTDLDNIAAGQNWAHAINQGLGQATALIYVSSEHSADSKWMNEELGTFLAQGRRTIPIILDDSGPNNMPEALQTIQWVDFRGEFKPAFLVLLSGIRHLQGDAPLTAAERKSKGYVFISYADEDAGFVTELKLFLKSHDYGYWDYRDSARDYQLDYTLELESVIKNAAGTLSIVSPDWKQSETAFQELHFSREVGTPVFLLKVRDPGPTLTISGRTFIDFMRKRDDGFTQLDAEMRRKGL